jgi:hypothetical protein
MHLPSLRPDDSCTIPRVFVDRRQEFSFIPPCYPRYDASDPYPS